MNQLDFKGRHAVVTGGATGLGYAIAQRLIERGADVTLSGRSGITPISAAAYAGNEIIFDALLARAPTSVAD